MEHTLPYEADTDRIDAFVPEGHLSPDEAFRHAPTLRELADKQGVKPLSNPRRLFGTWPGERDDGFEQAIQQLRQEGRCTEQPTSPADPVT